jgi:hypothetical protein
MAKRVRRWRSGHDGVWITNEHEAEAIKEQVRKPPSRLGVWVLRRLGYKGQISTQIPAPSPHPPHERSVRPQHER